MVRRWTKIPDHLDVEIVEQQDHRLGRHKVHDARSTSFALSSTVDRASWHTKSIRIYDPLPNPNQPVGNCTTCAKAMQLNAVGNRVKGEILDMDWALAAYSLETANDEFPGQWKPDDTGSSGLASAKTAILMREGGTYLWLFGGADEVVQAIMDGWVVSVGTWWYSSMFTQDSRGRIEPNSNRVGGHQYAYRGYDLTHDELIGRCWWDGFRDFRIRREHANDLLMDGGDAHTQLRVL